MAGMLITPKNLHTFLFNSLTLKLTSSEKINKALEVKCQKMVVNDHCNEISLKTRKIHCKM